MAKQQKNDREPKDDKPETDGNESGSQAGANATAPAVAPQPPSPPAPITPPVVPAVVPPAAARPKPDAVAYPVIVCIGCNSNNTVRIDEHIKKDFHKRRCRSCGKEFKEPIR